MDKVDWDKKSTKERYIETFEGFIYFIPLVYGLFSALTKDSNTTRKEIDAKHALMLGYKINQ